MPSQDERIQKSFCPCSKYALNLMRLQSIDNQIVIKFKAKYGLKSR